MVLAYEGVVDSTFVNVISDPRFDLSPEVDIQLYNFRKQIDVQVEKLAKSLKEIDTKIEQIDKLEKQLRETDNKTDKSLIASLKKMKDQLKVLRAEGQTPKPDRQVGAWQSFETTPYSKLRDVLSTSAAQTTLPSDQHKEQLKKATELIATFSKEVEIFVKKEWQSFESKIEKSHPNVFKE